MSTRSSSNLPVVSPNPSTLNPKRRNRRRSKLPFILEESPINTMANQRTMAELLRAPTEGYAEAIVVPSILSEQFELKHSLINMMTSDQFFGLEKDNPHDHIRLESPPVARKRTLALIHTWEDLVSEFINEFFPPQEQQISVMKSQIFNNEITKLTHAVNHQTSAVTTAMTAILKQFQATPPPAFVKAVEEICVTCSGAHPYYQCLAVGGNTFPELQDNIQGYVSAAVVNYNQGNSVYRPPGMAYQIRPPGFAQPNVQNNQNRFGQPQGFNRGNNFNLEQSYQAPTQQNQIVPLNELEKVKRINEANMKAMQTQINMVKNELRNKMKNSIQASLSNQTNEIKNMMDSLFQMNTTFTSGSESLPRNTIANPKGELKSITTRSGLVLDGPTIPTPRPFINPEEDERVEETLMDPDLSEYTIKVLPPPIKKYKPPSQRDYIVHQRDPLHPNIPYLSRMLKQKQQEKDEVQIHKFWKMFKQLHVNITLVDALILMPKYQKMLKALLSNKEKLQELANTPLKENYSGVILKKLPEKLRDLGKFLISCGFSELKCKALANLGASINLMPLSVWKKLGLPELISTCMTLELANLAICIPAGIARDVFVPVGKFTFPVDFVIVDYESDPRVPLILGRPFLRTACALINVHGEEMILRDEFLLHRDTNSSLKDSIDQSNLADNFVDSMPEMFTDEHALDYSSPPIFDEYDDAFLEVESDTENVYDDPFDSKGEIIKVSKLLIDELDLPCDLLPPFEYDSFISQDFSKVDAKPSTNNEDKSRRSEIPSFLKSLLIALHEDTQQFSMGDLGNGYDKKGTKLSTKWTRNEGSGCFDLGPREMNGDDDGFELSHATSTTSTS
nr:reverse transcriptase domain-containing protein [Tanacetum cinerariifolium]